MLTFNENDPARYVEVDWNGTIYKIRKFLTLSQKELEQVSGISQEEIKKVRDDGSNPLFEERIEKVMDKLLKDANFPVTLSEIPQDFLQQIVTELAQPVDLGN